MCRAIDYMEWKAQQWTLQTNNLPNVSPDLLQGLMAYAYKHADVQTSFSAGYAKRWILILKNHEFDFSFASKHETSDMPSFKGKGKENNRQEINVDPVSDWESDDENID